MAEARYLISDAARQVGVETHVLRYWEDELELAIPRNDMGHRYYTDYHIRLFCQIRDLKDRGYQLKAIRNALNKMSGAMENITITEELMEEEMKAAWKENHARAELTKEKAAGGAERQNEAERREGQTADGQAGRNEAAGGQIPRSGGPGRRCAAMERPETRTVSAVRTAQRNRNSGWNMTARRRCPKLPRRMKTRTASDRPAEVWFPQENRSRRFRTRKRRWPAFRIS